MVSITVLYKDLTHQKVAIEEIDTLAKDEVLFIKLSTDTRQGKVGIIEGYNLSQISGHDNYAYLTKRTGGVDWHMLYGWDDKEYIWRRDCKDCPDREVVDAPIGTMHVIFRGSAVSDGVWTKAKLIIDKQL